MADYKVGTLIHDGGVYEVFGPAPPSVEVQDRVAQYVKTLKPGQSVLIIGDGHRVVQTYAPPLPGVIDAGEAGCGMWNVTVHTDQVPAPVGGLLADLQAAGYTVPPKAPLCPECGGKTHPWRINPRNGDECDGCGYVVFSAAREYTDCGFVPPPLLPADAGDAPLIIGD